MAGKMRKHHLFWPLCMLGLLLIFNLLYSPDFFSLVMREGNLYGSLIDILNFGAPLILVSIGMTLVMATKGIDLSVGSIVAISGAVACMSISRGVDQSWLWLDVGCTWIICRSVTDLGHMERGAGLRLPGSSPLLQR